MVQGSMRKQITPLSELPARGRRETTSISSKRCHGIYDNLGGTADNMIITPHICDEHIWGYFLSLEDRRIC